ncbi:hypothetical protein BC826DRAFT_985647 [Russula brevipes]|nr:hypothetical protein BC826DRAFT_985647 [Russula brevipes]
MVSFQCDACTDVVKKPKLDRHHGQCRSSFTCIDCSATFAGPAQWKGHTSCVTEAEKYQKSLYKGPKRGSGPGNESQRNSNSQAKPMNAPGKYHQSHPTQSGWSRPQYTRNCASGANSTPLGSPRRMSPADPLPAEPSPSDANTATKTERGESKKRDSAAVLEVRLYVRQNAFSYSTLHRVIHQMGRNQKRRKGRRNTTLLERKTEKKRRPMKRPTLHLNHSQKVTPRCKSRTMVSLNNRGRKSSRKTEKRREKTPSRRR